jgi:hypothetical protein
MTSSEIRVLIKQPNYYLIKAFQISRLLNLITQCFIWQKHCCTQRDWSFQAIPL